LNKLFVDGRTDGWASNYVQTYKRTDGRTFETDFIRSRSTLRRVDLKNWAYEVVSSCHTASSQVYWSLYKCYPYYHNLNVHSNGRLPGKPGVAGGPTSCCLQPFNCTRYFYRPSVTELTVSEHWQKPIDRVEVQRIARQRRFISETFFPDNQLAQYWRQ